MSSLLELGMAAKSAAKQIANLNKNDKNKVLNKISKLLLQNSNAIIIENNKDIENGKKAGLNAGLIDRLTLNEQRIKGISDAVLKIIDLDDPVGKILSGDTLANGLKIMKVRVPLGVCGIIFEARPNVTVDAAVLCLKSGNAVMLRGGKEAIHSNKILVKIMRDALAECGVNKDAIVLVEDISRDSANEMMKLNSCLDVLIPRGGAGLIKAVVENATVPVIETGTGNCHIYIDEYADMEKGINILFNAKTSRPSVCNAAESLLVHKNIAEQFLPLAYEKLKEKNVTFYGCDETIRILGNTVLKATDDEYAKEFLDFVISVKVVDSVEQAAEHIDRYSTKHSEAIVTENYTNANTFINLVDSSSVYVNASTRFTDGGEFGFGAEIGISTQKLHARGPMGLEALTSYKYIIYGDGQIR